MKNALKLGFILSAIYIAIALIITNFIDTKTLFSGYYIWGSITVTLILLVLLGRILLRPKDYQGLSYGEALKYLFVACIAFHCMSQIATILIYGNNDRMKVAFRDYAIESQIAGLELGMSLGGANEAKIENETEKLRDQIASGEISLPEYPYQWSSLPLNLLTSVFLGLIYSLITAIFVKQKDH